MDVVLHPLTVNWGEYIRKDGNTNEGLVTSQSIGGGGTKNFFGPFSFTEEKKSGPARGESLADIVL